MISNRLAGPDEVYINNQKLWESQPSSYSYNNGRKPTNWGFGTGFLVQKAWNTGDMGKRINSHQALLYPFVYCDIWYKKVLFHFDISFGNCKAESIKINGDEFEGPFYGRSQSGGISLGYEVYGNQIFSVVSNIGILYADYNLFTENVIKDDLKGYSIKKCYASWYSLGIYIDYKIINFDFLNDSYLSARLKYDVGMLASFDSEESKGNTHQISLGLMFTLRDDKNR